MNENINLVEILKDCPKGTKLYSLVHGYVELYYVRKEDTEYPIRVYITGYDYTTGFTKGGGIFYDMPGECVLFPSKEQRDWSKFKVNNPKFDPDTLKPFDRVLAPDYNNIWKCAIFSHMEKDRVYPCSCADSRFLYCIPYNEDTKHLVGTSDEAPVFYRYWED